MTDSHETPVLVIGSGPAGWTAAIYAARAARDPLVVRGLQPGGQLTITTDVENYPGFPQVVQGPWLMEQMEEQVRAIGARIEDDIISDVRLDKRPFVCTGNNGTEYRAETVIIATGASARWLGLPSEERFRGHGVSACATCDGFFFRDKEVAVIGGGNTAVEEALFLTKFASRVTLVHRRNELRAERILQKRLFENERIEVLWDHVVTEILGDSDGATVGGVRLESTNGGDVRTLPIEGLFVAIGHTPNTEIFRSLLDMDDEGYIHAAPGSTMTSVPGVFAAGDVQDRIYRQAVTAAGQGCMAALEAEQFLANSGGDR